MRRSVGVVLITALGVALSAAVASADSLAVPDYNFSSAVYLRVFGETTDPAASAAAAYGDRASESPLRSSSKLTRDGFSFAISGSKI